MKNKVAALSIFLLASSFSVANAECPKWERLSQSGQKSIEAGDYSKAELTWLKAVTEAEFCGERDPALPLSLKRLGECYQKNGKFIDAADAFKKSEEHYKINGTDDSELATDQASLAKVYRPIELSEMNPKVADAFKESGVQLIGLSKIDDGNRIQMNLADKFVKTLDNKDVDQVSLDKLVSFDVVEQPDGTIAINNIKGLKVHAKMWVTIIQSKVQPNNPDGASADVTATKMGITKTVSCKLPLDSIAPMNTLIARLHDFNNGVVTASAGSATPSTSSATSSSGSAGGSTTSTSTTAPSAGTGATTSTSTTTPTGTGSTTSTSTTTSTVETGATTPGSTTTTTTTTGTDSTTSSSTTSTSSTSTAETGSSTSNSATSSSATESGLSPAQPKP